MVGGRIMLTKGEHPQKLNWDYDGGSVTPNKGRIKMETTEMPMFSKAYCDEKKIFDAAPAFRKKVSTLALRIEGPFIVDTSEGELKCADGYLCKDARGYPYPVAKDEFDLIYRPDSED